VRYIDMKPVRIHDAARQRKYARNKTGGLLFFNTNHMFAKIALMLVIAVTGGTSVAAESALPGDSLYGVKIHVNENVRGAVSLSTEAKAKWHAKRAERRTEEARALEAKGELNAETQAMIRTNIESHTQQAMEGAVLLETQGNVQAASAIQADVQTTLDIGSTLLGETINIRESVQAEETSTLQTQLGTGTKAVQVETVTEGSIRIGL